MARVIGILVVLIISLTLATGCIGKAVEKAAETAGERALGIDIDKKSDSVTIKGKDGESITVGSKIPEALKNFQVPSSEFKAGEGGSLSSGGDTLSTASWKGKGTVDNVVEFYKSSLPKQGWKETAVFTSGDGAMLSYTKDPDESLTITLSAKSGGEVEIAVLLGKTTLKATPVASPRASGASSTPTPASTPVSSRPQPTPTTAAPATTDSSALPEEMRGLPVVPGYQVVKGSTQRMTTEGKLSFATATWIGRTSVKDVGNFYKNSLPGNGWKEAMFETAEDEVNAWYENVKDPALNLRLFVTKTDAGTEVEIDLMR